MAVRSPRSGASAPAIAVLGPGGVGGMIAARTGALCVGTRRTVEAIHAGGLRLDAGGTTTIARLDAVETLERPVGLLVVAVKAHDLEDALARVDPEALGEALVLPLLNGLEHVEAIRTWLGAAPAQVAAGSIAAVEAYTPEPGLVVQLTRGAVVTAACHELGRVALETALAPLRVPGLEVVVEDDEHTVLWEKVVRLAVLAPATIAARAGVGDVRADAAWRPRIREALDEACAVAAADGVPLESAGQWAIIEALPATLTPSAVRDAAAGRPTELDAITGSVVRAGLRFGVETPTLRGLLTEAQSSVPA